SVNQGKTLVGSAATGVLKNDRDPAGGHLTAHRLRGPAHGTLLLRPDGSFRYTPRAGFTGTDSFTYRASDGSLVSGPAAVTIRVKAVPPVAVKDAYSVNQGTTLAVNAAAGVLKNDRDPSGGHLTASRVRGPAHGTLLLWSDGSFRYTPWAG